MSDANTCPNCEGRLIAGSKVCLHCGEEVVPVNSDAAESEGALGRFMVVAIAFIAILGAVAVVAVDVITEKLGEGIPKPQSFEETPSDKVCMPATAETQIKKLVELGAMEVAGEQGQRCFVQKTP